jgi:pyruvate dehydrogenase E2 component (dihydrolipoamide acetyltransferase)
MIWVLRMPRFDEDMLEGTVTHWLKKEGDLVQEGQAIVEIETQKVNSEVTSPGSGVLRVILAGDGKLVPVNDPIGVVADPLDDITAYLPNETVQDGEEGGGTTVPEPVLQAPAPSSPTRVLISPIAKRLAEEKGLDICLIRGTGPEGRITKEDVLNYKPVSAQLSSISTTPKVKELISLSGMRKTIADRLTRSWQASPRAEHFMSADVSELVCLREQYKEPWEREYNVRVTVNHFVIVSVAQALRAFPVINSALTDGKIEVYADVNISVAVALENGLVTPVVKQADSRSIFEIASELKRLEDLVRSGEHSRNTLAGSTFTVTNLGMFGVEFFVPVLNPPESAILAVGKIEKRPAVVNDSIAVRSIMTLCLAYDHRVLDGAVAARFLQHVTRGLEHPKSLLPKPSA